MGRWPICQYLCASVPSCGVGPRPSSASDQRSSRCSFSCTSFHSSASAGAGFVFVIEGQSFASSAFSAVKCCWSPGTSSSA
ncbi:hypothetical protein DM47_3712 [Burkholderia mallei]|nr:hypothetical protein DM47_3712 [Burkholderia mallei]